MNGRARAAIVTGASRGIGRATAVRPARDFGFVTVVARSSEDLASTAQAVRDAGAVALVVALDLEQPHAAAGTVERSVEAFGRVDALVTVAGAVSQADLFELDDEAWADSLALKFHSTRRLAIAAWPHLKATRGAIAITSGTSAVTPKAPFAAVGTINAAISALAKCFAERGQADGIRVNSVSPGPVMTDRRRSMLERYAARSGLDLAAAAAAFAKEAGIARYGAPEDIAEAFAWLVSPASAWVNGANLRIDGGEIKAV